MRKKRRQTGLKRKQKGFSRRAFIKLCGAAGLALCLPLKWGTRTVYAQIPGGTLDPLAVPKYQTPLLIPPVMPRAGTIKLKGGPNADYYEISPSLPGINSLQITPTP